ncbi:MAG: trypsin-like peptidase domain-containing protein [Bacteroidales bacterium]|nr:trypsin-like peptidase domain-containing protein [Bacteroidales bacterium]
MTDIPPYIVPIGCYENNESKFCGTGFIVGDYLITAYHVIRKALFSGAFAVINNNQFNICASNQRNKYTSNLKDKDHFDVAIISLRGRDLCNPNKNDEDFIVDSPLKLSIEVPQKGLQVSTKFFQGTFPELTLFEETENEVCDFPFTSLPESLYQRWDTSFTIRHSGRITHGSSGSPVLIGNKVIGIITNGLDKQNLEKYNLPLDYLYYCECLRVDVLKSQFPELFG